jgi:hypothetical protein
MADIAPLAIVDLLVDAAVELRVTRASGTLEPGVAAWMLRKFNRLVDRWNATPGATFDRPLQSFVPVITAGHQPQTLGPSAADWLLTEARPNLIIAANVILTTSTPNVRVPITVHNDYGEWWAANAVQAMTSAIVTDLYYETSHPNGKCWLWPVPTVAYPIELQFDDAFATYAMGDTVYVPPAYLDAFVLSLAEDCASGLGQAVPDSLARGASDARVNAFGASLPVPRNAKTRDAGMPGGSSGRGYLYRTGRSKSS